MLKLVFRAAAALLFLSLGSAAMAASGTALGVDPDAAAEAKGDTRTLVVGADIFIGDRVVTGPSGLVQILFSDNTRLVVGPQSALLIEDYLLREDGSNGKLAIEALSGTFRFITGRAAKDRYIINTPTGTIGVRGTALDIFATKLVTYILQLEGSTEDCPDKSPDDCQILEVACQMGALDPEKMEVIGHTDDLNGEDRDKAKEMFRLAFSQHDLLRQFRVPGAERCFRRPASNALPSDPDGGSMSDPQGEPPPPNPRSPIRGLQAGPGANNP